MKRFVLLIITGIPLLIWGQNLVPNPGFEQNVHGFVTEWWQPTDDYYHYKIDVVETDSGTFYNARNGLCLLNPDPSEFLVAKLNTPLVKGQTYCIKLNVYYSITFRGHLHNVQSIDVAFSDTVITVHKRRLLFREPRIRFPLIDSANRHLRQPDQQTFIADGTEQYIIIGKFHSIHQPVGTWATYDEMKMQLYREQYYAGDSIKKYYNSLLPAMQMTSSKKEQKRETKRINDSITKLETLKREALLANAQFFAQKVLELRNRPTDDTANIPSRYHVRLYFDNICVSPVSSLQECSCSKTTTNTFEVGQTYRLNRIHFDLDKSTFRPESYAEMNNLRDIMLRHPNMYIQINGHTDSLNTEQYNQELSNRRAKAVYDYLIKQGIAPLRLSWKGFGETVPITDNSTEEGRLINRRVEFTVLKNNE